MLSGRYNTSSWNQTWGAEFPLYLSSLNPFFPIATNAGLDSAKKFLQVLKRASFSVISPPKFTDFYSLLYLQLDPANIAYLDNTSVVSGCIALLRQYTEDIKSENKGLLSHSFGFYCFRTLVLGIQAGILSCSNDFDTVVETYHYLSNAEHVSAGLAYIVNRAIVQAESIFDVLDPVIVPDTDISIFLRSVGGISNADVDFLLDALWKDRDVMTYLSASYITPGWTCILWVIGQHMIWSLQLERNEKFAWDRYRELCFRRSLFSMPEEFEYLDDVCNELRGFKCFGDTYSGFVVDQADAENILDAYIKWVPSAEIVYPLRLAANFVGYITEDELLKPARPMAEFVGATSQGIWLALQEVDRSMSEDLITYCTGVFECYKKMFQLHNSKTLTHIANSLHSNDFIELTSQIILSPLSHGAKLLDLLQVNENDSDAVRALKLWDKLLQSLNTFAYYVPREVREGASESLHEWGKMRYWLSVYSVLGLPRRIQQYIDNCRFVWDTLGLACGYFSPDNSLEKKQCAYPRCPGPCLAFGVGFVCGSCLETAYCNEKCQGSDWTIASVDSHCTKCLDLGH